MEVVAPVAPAADVDAPHVGHRAHGTLTAHEHPSQLTGLLVVELAEIDVASRKEQDDARQAVRRGRRRDEPSLVTPDGMLVAALTAPAIRRVLADARSLGLDRRLQGARP